MSDRCDLSDLLVTECACRIHKPVPAMDEPRRGPVIEASFGGSCDACEGRIRRGDQITRGPMGFYIHAECAE